MKRREANERPDCNKQKEYNTKRAKEVAIERVREIKKTGCLLLTLKASINGKTYRLIRDSELKPILF